jgi:hypothetical protein
MNPLGKEKPPRYYREGLFDCNQKPKAFLL